MKSFTQMVIMAMITNPEDGKSNNYFVVEREDITGTKTGHLVAIDNDHYFVPSFIKEFGWFGWKAVPFVKSILFCMDEMFEHVNTEFIEGMGRERRRRGGEEARRRAEEARRRGVEEARRPGGELARKRGEEARQGGKEARREQESQFFSRDEFFYFLALQSDRHRRIPRARSRPTPLGVDHRRPEHGFPIPKIQNRSHRRGQRFRRPDLDSDALPQNRDRGILWKTLLPPGHFFEAEEDYPLGSFSFDGEGTGFAL
jgi:hypothetical protein